MTNRLFSFAGMRFFLILFFSAALMAEAAPKEEDVLRIGITPFNTPVALLKTHQPLRDYLELALNRPVMLFTSSRHGEFLRDSLNGRFDVVITPPHMGAILLQRDFVPLVRYKNEMDFIFVVRADEGFTTVSTLRGKKIAFPDRMAVFTIAGIKLLEDMGMKRDVDYIYSEHPTHAAAMMSVVMGMADAAVTGYPPLNQMPVNVREKLKVLPWGKSLPHLMTLAMKQLGSHEIQRLKRAFERFPDTPGGRKFFSESGYDGYSQISEEDLKTIQPYMLLTLEILEKEEKERAKTP
ncbi:MAG: phosphate/phosphite/phosphonate ABC transporter substrate-binding protein [Zoogloeaceae bacterium]|jgi:phosphonate transport system substrate-binding protein|nr:phosphate/phosphite/phosphonate ABC transporter substrate-binding protein [Zoogloeaceae bacterium]